MQPGLFEMEGQRKMDRTEDIEFLERFRSSVVEYLTNTGTRNHVSEAHELRKKINEMKSKVSELLKESEAEIVMVEQPPLALGPRAPVVEVNLLDLITSKTQRSFFISNLSDEYILDLTLDMVDKGIGHLKTIRTGVTSVKKGQKAKSQSSGQGRVFIAMPMTTENPQLEDIHEAVKNAASDVGLFAERVDEQISNEKITDRIIEAIEKADFVVADLSHARPNVYWEAGYAHGLEKTPIYIARKGTELEFDVKDYPVIFYENATRLRMKLAERLQGLKNAS